MADQSEGLPLHEEAEARKKWRGDEPGDGTGDAGSRSGAGPALEEEEEQSPSPPPTHLMPPD
jgi:hypothetical protein